MVEPLKYIKGGLHLGFLTKNNIRVEGNRPTMADDREGERAILDSLSGYEFEDLMVDVFRNLGYENVRVSRKSGDEGRDILMEEELGDGRRRAVVVECKHTQTVSRPVVQKLHSATTTYDYEGERKGMVVTSGRFTGPAEEYVGKVNSNPGNPTIELLDGNDLREIGEEIGLDLYSGKIEVICDETLPYPPNRSDVESKVLTEFNDINNFDPEYFSETRVGLRFLPLLYVKSDVNAVFETSVGVIHRVNTTDSMVIKAKRGETTVESGRVEDLVRDNLDRTVLIEEGKLKRDFDEVDFMRFGRTETDYKDFIYETLQDKYETTVTYTGDNNVTYNKTCTPRVSDINIREILALYVPNIEAQKRAGDYAYSYEYLSAHPTTLTLDDGIHECVHCGTARSTFTFCKNCGSINCSTHTKTERWEQAPVCTGCAVTERFFLKQKYFYDEENLERFREEYESMPLHKKALENKILAVVIVMVVLFIAVLLASSAFSLVAAGMG